MNPAVIFISGGAGVAWVVFVVAVSRAQEKRLMRELAERNDR